MAEVDWIKWLYIYWVQFEQFHYFNSTVITIFNQQNDRLNKYHGLTAIGTVDDILAFIIIICIITIEYCDMTTTIKCEIMFLYSVSIVWSFGLLSAKRSPTFTGKTQMTQWYENLELYLSDLRRLHSDKHTGYTGLMKSFIQASHLTFTLSGISRQQNIRLPHHRHLHRDFTLPSTAI